MLYDLANVAGFEQKRAAMIMGEHINQTENRAVMHVALRAPKSLGLSALIQFPLVLLNTSQNFATCGYSSSELSTLNHSLSYFFCKGKPLLVDGEDVLPAVHAVLEKVGVKSNSFCVAYDSHTY
jgi:glucose-6-phosphate isomerase